MLTSLRLEARSRSHDIAMFCIGEMQAARYVGLVKLVIFNSFQFNSLFTPGYIVTTGGTIDILQIHVTWRQ